jgi:hypothetical protein
MFNNPTGNPLLKQTRQMIRPVLGCALAVIAIANAGCSAVGLRQIKDGLQPRVLVTEKNEDKANLYNEIGLAQRTRAEAYIQILGSDVELPPTAGADQTSDVRKYYFDIWVDQSLIDNPKQAIHDGKLVIDVANVKATFEEVAYGNSLYMKKGDQKATSSAPLTSRSIIRVVVNSRDITQSFTIIAKLNIEAGKFESERGYQLQLALSEYKIKANECNENCRKKRHPSDKFESYEKARERAETKLFEQNPYMATRIVKVFNGDLHTQVYMLSDTETKDAFGSNFARSYYVGKAYLRNRHTENKLIVHTTSLRARTLFYREPQTKNGTSKAGIFDRIGSRLGDDFGGNESSEARDYLYTLSLTPGSPQPPLTDDQENRIKNYILESKRMKIIRDNDASTTDVKLAQDIVDELLPKNLDIGQVKNEEKSIKDEEKARIESMRISAESLAMNLIVIARASAEECFGKTGTDEYKLAEKYADKIFSYSLSREEIVVPDEKSEKVDKLKEVARCFDEKLDAGIMKNIGRSSPIALDMRRRVGLTNKIAAASQDTRWQEKLSRHGYFWEDFYRPMTFESVLLSLTARTRAHPMNRALKYLESLGVVAGALVGMEQISSAFGGEAFAQRVAVSTGVFVPEMKKLLLRDIDQYLGNLASTALPSIVTLAPNESRDGYVFFPRGPIYGYGVDEFSINEPSFIVNIDNEDVSVDGALIEGEVQFSAGQQAAANTLVENARSQGEKQVSEQLTKLADLEAKLFAYRSRHIVSAVCEMLDNEQFIPAKKYLDEYKKDAEKNAAIQDLLDRTNAGIKCDQTLPDKLSASPDASK